MNVSNIGSQVKISEPEILKFPFTSSGQPSQQYHTQSHREEMIKQPYFFVFYQSTLNTLRIKN